MSTVDFSQIGQPKYDGLDIDGGHLKVVYCCLHTFKPNGHKLNNSQVENVIRKLLSKKPEDMQTMPEAFVSLRDAEHRLTQTVAKAALKDLNAMHVQIKEICIDL